MTENDVCLLFSTCDNESTAAKMAESLVAKKLAACVNILPSIRSIYTWKGKIQNDTECMLIIKTTNALFADIQEWSNNNHPYEVPELLTLNPNQISPAYLSWIAENLGS